MGCRQKDWGEKRACRRAAPPRFRLMGFLATGVEQRPSPSDSTRDWTRVGRQEGGEARPPETGGRSEVPVRARGTRKSSGRGGEHERGPQGEEERRGELCFNQGVSITSTKARRGGG